MMSASPYASLTSHTLLTKVKAACTLAGALTLAACSGSVEQLEPSGGAHTPGATGGAEASGGAASSPGNGTSTGAGAATGGVVSTGGVTSSGGAAAGVGGTAGGGAQDPERLREGCNAGKDFALVVKGSTPHEWQGHSVSVAAYQNDAGVHSRVVRLSDRVGEGALALECNAALEENYEYPSVGVVVDVDGDGVCSAGDLGIQLQLYGWAKEVLVDIAEADWTPVGSLHSPLGSETDDFCAGYFVD